jgi:hypothetical protein
VPQPTVPRKPRAVRPISTTLVRLIALPLGILLASCNRASSEASVSLEPPSRSSGNARGVSSPPTTRSEVPAPAASSAPGTAAAPDSFAQSVAVQPEAKQSVAHCPKVPLKNGAACKEPGECTYVDCAGPGRVTVRCNGSKVNVETLPCGPFRCGGVGGIDCDGDTLCVERSSGYHDFKCVANPCGKAPLSCECAGSLCPGHSCTMHGTFVKCGGGCSNCP